MRFFSWWLLAALVMIAPAGAMAADSNAEIILSPEFESAVKKAEWFSVAVLPVSNQSVDPEVAYYFRQAIIEHMRAKGYTLFATEEVDAKLNELGVTNAEQISLLTYPMLMDALQADAVLTGVVESASSKTAVVYNDQVFVTSLKLQDRDGNVLWAALQERIAKRRFALDPLNVVVDTILVKKDDTELATMALAERMLQTLPDGPVNVVFEDSLFDQAVEITVTGDGESQ